jgi:hypothetical protein
MMRSAKGLPGMSNGCCTEYMRLRLTCRLSMSGRTPGLQVHRPQQRTAAGACCLGHSRCNGGLHATPGACTHSCVAVRPPRAHAPGDDAVWHLPALHTAGTDLDVQARHRLGRDRDVQVLEAGPILGQHLVLEVHVHHKPRLLCPQAGQQHSSISAAAAAAQAARTGSSMHAQLCTAERTCLCRCCLLCGSRLGTCSSHTRMLSVRGDTRGCCRALHQAVAACCGAHMGHAASASGLRAPAVLRMRRSC